MIGQRVRKPDGFVLGRGQLELFVRCPRCFWLLRRHGISLPKGFPPTLYRALEGLLIAEFDRYRKRGLLHPLLKHGGVDARPFRDLDTLQTWRSAARGLRWRDPATGWTLHAPLTDLLEDPDRRLVVLDYAPSGSNRALVRPEHRLHVDLSAFLLARMGYKTSPKAYRVFFMIGRNHVLPGRLALRGDLVSVPQRPKRILRLFRQAVATAESDRMPRPSASCDLCRWFAQAVHIPRRDIPRHLPVHTRNGFHRFRPSARKQEGRFKQLGGRLFHFPLLRRRVRKGGEG
jgi:hypothetical protein